MDINGFHEINSAIEDATGSTDIYVNPVPNDGDNFQFLDIETLPDIPPTDVLNALAKHGLIHRYGVAHTRASWPKDASIGPRLRPISISGNTIVFEDVAASKFV